MDFEIKTAHEKYMEIVARKNQKEREVAEYFVKSIILYSCSLD